MAPVKLCGRIGQLASSSAGVSSEWDCDLLADASDIAAAAA
ncbi:hypothetical protein [Streptomyces bauhiniae]